MTTDEALPKVTARALDALRLLRRMKAGYHSIEGTTGGPFSRAFWPETAKRGGTGRNHGLRRRGGAYLSHLMKLGLVTHARGDGWNSGYKLSTLGERVVDAAEASDG